MTLTVPSSLVLPLLFRRPLCLHSLQVLFHMGLPGLWQFVVVFLPCLALGSLRALLPPPNGSPPPSCRVCVRVLFCSVRWWSLLCVLWCRRRKRRPLLLAVSRLNPRSSSPMSPTPRSSWPCQKRMMRILTRPRLTRTWLIVMSESWMSVRLAPSSNPASHMLCIALPLLIRCLGHVVD